MKRTGEVTVLPGMGEHTFTPTVVAVQLGGGGVLTVILSGVLNTAPLESQACTTMLWVPELTGKLTSRLAAVVA